MISFYPGPSRVYNKIPRYVKDAYAEGIMSINHRSEECVAMTRNMIEVLKDKLSVPSGYHVYFVSSATECWEIIAQSLVDKGSHHIYNGAFGERWYQYTRKITGSAVSVPFDMQGRLQPTKVNRLSAELLCLTQNETSNGTQLSLKVIKNICVNNPNALIAIDATSSMGGVALDFEYADIWFASVQKCFGLPAGMGVLICSPRAIARAQALNKNSHYNSLLFLHSMMEKWQTPYTPNVLGIYLLGRVMEDSKPIKKIHNSIKSRYKKWESFFDTKSHQLNFLIRDKGVRSHTVLTIEAEPALIQKIKQEAKLKGLLFGNGYGTLNESTLRIANFPAIQRKEIAQLMDFLYGFI